MTLHPVSALLSYSPGIVTYLQFLIFSSYAVSVWRWLLVPFLTIGLFWEEGRS